ncbi:hypothetical protein L195_g017938 [Trifolium pratense]|uniref:Transmembrane protein n=2 Tax=Trifolium pratense TaxID=57577 RepID=A0A2K3MVC2_TRIPR|nr:hypothetical protein L195_g017938 [Trifolium pratense]CAJ2649504.1 unnamed protein product [Trifolium pratense]
MSFNNNNNTKSSSSSLPSNPSPRNSEISNPMRRSFTGNPFAKPSLIANPRSTFSHTPANSPSDFSRKSFVDDKENVKDQILKPAKIRSPAATSKSTKNFMSPTISASIKMAESPRKKILTERNEPAPCSDPKVHMRKVTFADPLEQKSLDASFDGSGIPFPCYESEDLSDETLSDSNVVSLIPMDDLSFDNTMQMNVPLIPQNEIHTESIFENVSQEPDFVNLDPTFKLSPAAATPPVSYTANVIDPLDADPSMPPYDPKTNYLSPRPQFLHYKPKPRMDLEDSFILSGNFSDTEVTEDTQSDESQKESEDASSDETVKREEDEISEPSPVRTVMPDKTIEAKELRKSRFSLRSKAFALILLLSVAFVSFSISNSPGIDLAVFEEFYGAYKSSEFSEFARANFDQFSQFAKANYEGLSRNLHIWFTKSLSSISEFISDVKGARSVSQLQYFNLTLLHDYIEDSQFPIFGGGENVIGDTHLPAQEKHADSEIVMDEYFGDYEVYEEQLPVQEVDVEDAPESEEAFKGQSVTLVEPQQALQPVESAREENQTPRDHDGDSEYKPSSNSETAEIHSEEVCGEGSVDTRVESEENNVKLNGKESDADLKHSPVSGSEAAETHTDDKALGKSASMDATIRGNEQSLEATHIPPNMVLYLLLCAGTIFIAGATFNWSRKVNGRSKKITNSVKKPEIESENKQVPLDKPSLRNAPVEMDVVGESCPSEMSSFDNSSSYRVNQSNETISVEKKRRNNHRRESLASSDNSMGSPSYGSLTVFEKIPKGRRGEEEIVTPVRRSSRIRSLATSPV